MANTVKLSDTMVKAILGSVAYGDRMELNRARTGTVVALMERGVVELQREELESGAVIYHYVLTSRRGHFLLGFLREYPAGREWLTSVLDGPAPEPSPECGIRASRSVELNTDTQNVTCARPTGHLGRHWSEASLNVAWDDNESWQEPAEPVFTVKLWYVTGAFEAPTGAENLCRTVFEEALSNDRVIAGELHDARGITLEAFGRSA